MPIIAFTGFKGSGKDTAAAPFLAAGYARLAFADGIKAMLSGYLDYRGLDALTNERMLNGDLKETPTEHFEGRSPRHALQTLGTEWGRQLVGPNIWVNATVAQAKLWDAVVIADVRFENEARAIREAGGSIYKVVRLDLVPTDPHTSEAHIDNIEVDGVLLNDFDTAEDFSGYVAYRFGLG